MFTFFQGREGLCCLKLSSGSSTSLKVIFEMTPITTSWPIDGSSHRCVFVYNCRYLRFFILVQSIELPLVRSPVKLLHNLKRSTCGCKSLNKFCPIKWPPDGARLFRHVLDFYHRLLESPVPSRKCTVTVLIFSSET